MVLFDISSDWRCFLISALTGGYQLRLAMLFDISILHLLFLQGIWEDVERSMGLMQSQLLASLRASIQLPACLRVVGYLRRMECFSPAELRLRFLQARDTWLTSVLSAIPRDDRELRNAM